VTIRPEQRTAGLAESSRGWTEAQARTLVAAARQAPVWCSEHPWVVEVVDQRVALYELNPHAWREHDGHRDRLLSCGAAVANLRIAGRAAGRTADCELGGTPQHPDLAATVHFGQRHSPSQRELALADALPTVHETRSAPRLDPVDHATAHQFLVESTCPGVVVTPLSRARDLAALAELVAHTRPTDDLVPWLSPAGAASTREQELSRIAARLAADQVAVVLTPDDTRRDLIAAGAALQTMRLTAHVEGLGLLPVLAPLRLPAVRAGLIERLDLPGYPQALVRIGQPGGSQAPLRIIGTEPLARYPPETSSRGVVLDSTGPPASAGIRRNRLFIQPSGGRGRWVSLLEPGFQRFGVSEVGSGWTWWPRRSRVVRHSVRCWRAGT
jgi:nitroreductase